LLGEHLDAIAGPIADIDESVFGNANCVDWGLEVLGARLTLLTHIGLTLIADLVERLAIGAPAAFEISGIPVVNHHALIQIAIRDIDFAGGFIERGCGDAAEQKIRLLIILFLRLAARDLRASVAKILDEFTVAAEFQQRVAGLRAGEEVVTSANFLIDSESRFRAAIAAFSKKRSLCWVAAESAIIPDGGLMLSVYRQ
jgi:hypothetical protein